MSLKKQENGLYQGGCPLKEGDLGNLLAEFEAEIVIGHPTFRNADNIGKELTRGIKAAADVYSGKKVAFIVSDGSYRMDSPDATTITAALEASKQTFQELEAKDRKNLLVIATPYDGYKEDRTPGKGSALKLLFDEVALCPSMKKLILLDGDLRNDFKP